MTFRVRSEAAADVIGAKEWYEEQREGLGLEFSHEVENTIALIARMPKAFPRVHREMRRALLERFPYALYYRLPDPDTLEVVACLHTRRNPHILRSRSIDPLP